MSGSTLIIERSENVAHVIMNRPDVMNALNKELVDDIYHSFKDLEGDETVRAIVLSGAGKGFCAGGDVSFLEVINSHSPAGTRRFLGELFHKLTVLARIEKPVIGALHGVAVGAGFSLALLCDVRLAASDTRFGAEFVMMGIIPELGCTHLLPNLVGLGKAMELVLTARRFDAVEAEKMGVVNRVVPGSEVIEEALALARHMAGLPPLPMGLSKAALRRGLTGDLRDGIELEADINALCYQTEDHKEAASAFLQKRKPVFKGR